MARGLTGGVCARAPVRVFRGAKYVFNFYTGGRSGINTLNIKIDTYCYNRLLAGDGYTFVTNRNIAQDTRICLNEWKKRMRRRKGCYTKRFLSVRILERSQLPNGKWQITVHV